MNDKESQRKQPEGLKRLSSKEKIQYIVKNVSKTTKIIVLITILIPVLISFFQKIQNPHQSFILQKKSFLFHSTSLFIVFVLSKRL